jgi:hypothetical protein
MNQAIQYLADKKLSQELIRCITEFQNCIANVDKIFSSHSGLFFCYYFKKQIPHKLFFSLDITPISLLLLLNQYHQKFLANADVVGCQSKD